MRLAWVSLAMLPTIAAACPQRGAYYVSFTGRVTAIADGDTLTVHPQGEKPVKIRLWGIDAPENGQPYSAEAKRELAAMAHGKVATVTPKDVDRYGRIVALITVPFGDTKARIEVNRTMVSKGAAWWFRKYAPRETPLEQYERAARAARRGLWAAKTPVAPWEWRR